MMRQPVRFAAAALLSVACSRQDPAPVATPPPGPEVTTGVVQQAVVSCPLPTSGGAATCVLDDANVSADTTVSSGFADDNFGNGFEMCATTTTKAIIRWDLSVIPAGMVIQTASLAVSVGRIQGNAASASASVFRVTGPSSWTEASPTYPTSATRSCGTTTQNLTRSNNHAYGVGACTNVAPEVAGFLGGACGAPIRNVTFADRSATSAITFNKVTLSAARAQNTVITAGTESFSGANLVADVQGWRDATLTNNGWAIVADASSAGFVMSASEGTANTFPHLTVTYKRKDGQICSSSAECDSGACSGRCCASGSLCTDSSLCTDDACNSSGTCLHTNNTAACNDGNACTLGDQCNGAGTCVGTPMVCNALDQCHVAGTCSAGICSNPSKANGTACSDGNACTIGDTCQSGICSGTAMPCPAIDQCHNAGACSAGMCSAPNKPNGTVCDDGNSCTSGETCQSGVCTGGVGTVCTALDQCHNVGTCSGGVCTNPIKPNGSACNLDNNACTQNDTCQAGACAAGPAVVCAAPDQCHNAGTCVPATGICSYPNKTNGTACNDGLACTTPDTCTSGTCGGPARVCDDGIACTVDSCSEPGGCTVNTSGCGCTKDADCDDANACNGKETCNTTTLACRAGTPVNCSSLTDGCNTGTCAPATGACSAVPKPNGTSCTDGASCTTGDACQSGVCKGTPVVCPLPDQCHNAGTCAPATGTCSNPPKTNGTACNDANACTTADTCQGGTCTGGPALPCNDSNQCTIDGCAAATGCTFTPGNAGAVCVPASCTGGRETLVSACTGSAPACPTAVTRACAPYACGATACLTKCTVDTDCSLGNYCAAGGVCTAKLAPGGKCTAGNQCVSSFCADGVCCNQDCDGQCEACNLPNKAGTCSPVTGKPVAPRAACIGNGTGCDGACDGTNTTACAVPSQSKQCRDPSCNATTGVATLAESCNGSGACPAVRTQDCAPGICGQTQCTGCSTNADCPTGDFCRGGVCKPQSAAGIKCSIDAECASGHCVDGVCCDNDCTGQCEACNQPNAVGKCTPIAANQQPAQGRPSCVGKAPCGGVCDGTTTRACTYPGPGVSCRDAKCTSGNAVLAAFCDGAGSCPAQSEKACPPGATCVNDTLCGGTPSSCTSDGDCGRDDYCAGGVCSSKNENGVSCNTASECRSGICVDGFCCTQACAGQCEACDVPGSEGTCSPVVGGPHGSRQACSSDGTICGGSCNGATGDRCSYAGLATPCRPGKCAGGLADLAAFCQGNGSCAPLQQQSCDPVGCNGARCNGPCLVDDDCAAAEYCSAGMCVPKVPNGVTCGSPEHCTSGNCVDGLCCDKACTGQCEACDQVGHLGACTAVSGAPRDGRPGCLGSGACGGFCNGTSGTTCSLPGANVVCGVAFCTEGAVTNEPKCNSAATCVIPASVSCDPYTCDPTGSGCLSTCQVDTDCATGLVCLNGGCAQPVADGGVVVDAGAPDASTGQGGGAGTAGSDGGAAGSTGGNAGSGGAPGSSGTGGSRPGGNAGTSSVDAGVSTGPDGGKKPAEGHDDGGCGCRVQGAPASGARGIAAVLAGLLLLAARRRRAPGRGRYRPSQRPQSSR
jgi:MYXO-CTERM domain-containing protein